MTVILHQNNIRVNDDVIHSGATSSVPLPEAPQTIQHTRFAPDDSWIEEKREVTASSSHCVTSSTPEHASAERREFKHTPAEKREFEHAHAEKDKIEYEQNRRPTRQQHHQKGCVISKCLGDDRKCPQGKPDSCDKEGPQGKLKPSGANGRQVHSICEGRSSPEVRSICAPGVHSICDGNASHEVRSNIFGARKEHFAAAPRSVFGSSGSRGKEENDMFGKPFPKTPSSLFENPIPFSIETRADDISEGNSSRSQFAMPDELKIEKPRENAEAPKVGEHASRFKKKQKAMKSLADLQS